MATSFSTPGNRAAYYELVWDLVRQIPKGKVSTYGRLAAFLPPPAGMSEVAYQVRGARMVGGAMAACPAGVPWQRVINAQGKISQRRGAGGEEQRNLLEEEGVVFDDRDRVNLAIYGWEGPPEGWFRI